MDGAADEPVLHRVEIEDARLEGEMLGEIGSELMRVCCLAVEYDPSSFRLVVPSRNARRKIVTVRQHQDGHRQDERERADGRHGTKGTSEEPGKDPRANSAF